MTSQGIMGQGPVSRGDGSHRVSADLTARCRKRSSEELVHLPIF